MFNGLYTIRNIRTGEHRTFAVRTQKEDARFAPGKRVIGLLSGPDNDHDYVGFGFVSEDNAGNDRVWIWRKKQVGDFLHYAKMVEEAARVLGRSFDAEVESGAATFDYGLETYEVQASKRCYRCNRTLTTPESLRRGVGPECAQILGVA